MQSLQHVRLKPYNTCVQVSLLLPVLEAAIASGRSSNSAWQHLGTAAGQLARWAAGRPLRPQQRSAAAQAAPALLATAVHAQAARPQAQQQASSQQALQERVLHCALAYCERSSSAAAVQPAAHALQQLMSIGTAARAWQLVRTAAQALQHLGSASTTSSYSTAGSQDQGAQAPQDGPYSSAVSKVAPAAIDALLALAAAPAASAAEEPGSPRGAAASAAFEALIQLFKLTVQWDTPAAAVAAMQKQMLHLLLARLQAVQWLPAGLYAWQGRALALLCALRALCAARFEDGIAVAVVQQALQTVRGCGCGCGRTLVGLIVTLGAVGASCVDLTAVYVACSAPLPPGLQRAAHSTSMDVSCQQHLLQTSTSLHAPTPPSTHTTYCPVASINMLRWYLPLQLPETGGTETEQADRLHAQLLWIASAKPQDVAAMGSEGYSCLASAVEHDGPEVSRRTLALLW